MSAFPTFRRRYLSLWLPFLSTDRVRHQHARHNPDLNADTPLVLVSKTDGTHRVMAADRAAQHSGLTVGMALAQARAMVPSLCILPHDVNADARLLEVIADWSDRYTPLVGRDPPYGLVFDITGAAHLLGGESQLRADLMRRLARQGIHATVAIAPTVGAAWALSRCSSSGSLDGGSLPEDITRAGLDAALSSLPVNALRIAPDATSALRRVGLKRIGDLIGRPRAALAARFGATLILRLDQARGIDTESINPRQPIPPAVVEHGFVEPILATSAVEHTCRHLADQLSSILVDRGQGATALQLSVYRVDGFVKRIDLRLASPCRHGKTMADLMALRLGHLDDPLDPGFGYDLIRLAATAVAPKNDEACQLTGLDDQSGPVHLAFATDALINRLAARFGENQTYTLANIDTHIPEHASRLECFREKCARVSRQQTPQKNEPGLICGSTKAGAIGVPTLNNHRKSKHSSAPDADPLPRPLRLFDPPESVEVMAEVPDGPPIHLRWRRRPLRIVQAHGPERIAPEWWQPASLSEPEMGEARIHATTRDYWRIEDASGRRLWLYREGSYGSEFGSQALQQPRWYVHGLFA